MSTNNNESFEILKYSLEHFDKEVESHCNSLKNESDMICELLKKNLQSELLNLPNSIRNMTMGEFLQQCLDVNNLNAVPQHQNKSSTATSTAAGTLSLSELLFSPGTEKSTNSSYCSNSTENESMNDIKQKVIEILNSPKLLLKKKGINNNNNNNNNNNQ